MKKCPQSFHHVVSGSLQFVNRDTEAQVDHFFSTLRQIETDLHIDNIDRAYLGVLVNPCPAEHRFILHPGHLVP